MKHKHSEAVLIKQTHANDYNERYQIFLPSGCDMCCCRSCTGFNCPWVGKHERFESSGNKTKANRCEVCRKRNFGRIYDCDYYTYYRRRKFFKPRKYKRRKSELELVNEKLALIMERLEILES